MKTVIIHGQSHKGSTYHAAHILAGRLGGEIQEFFLPKDFGEFCTGCCACFTRSESLCPHAGRLNPIREAMDAADVIVLASPVYVMRATGPMKAFLDHFGARFMVHRPQQAMFSKQGVCISTTAGAGSGNALRDMAASLFWWGIGRIYKAGFTVRAVNWSQVTDKKKAKIERRMDQIAAKVRARAGHVRPSLRTRLTFLLVRLLRRILPGDVDKEYWASQGWLGSARPWRGSRAPQG